VQEVIRLIQQTLHIELALAEDTPLLSSGLVDSFGLVVLLAAIEEEYDVTLDESEIGVDTFDTPAQVHERIRIAAVKR
jgi:acyl carrier protein